MNLKSGQSLKFREFELPYRKIQVEGFEDWFDFGNGIGLFIKIRISANEPNPKEAPNFHLHSILCLIQSRLSIYQNIGNPINLRHRTSVAYRKTITIRRRIDPNTESAFWSTPVTSIPFDNEVENISDQQLSEYGRRNVFVRNAFPNDLQIGNDFFDKVAEEKFCNCNEWCNLNAFFYHNLIIRFLMVGHNQLYLQNKTNIPSLY
jgi:hypothetical protein